jgi:hypothetical protein
VVVLVEVGRKAYLASIVPVIVNAILNEHQIVVDIVAFVNRGDFPRSRLGEKQRGKILASWVTRKMRTMAQFGIRDPESGLSDVTETMEPRSGMGSIRNGSVIASSLRNVEPAPQIIEEQERERQMLHSQNSFAPLPTGISEMPADNYDNSMLGSPSAHSARRDNDETPLGHPQSQYELPSSNFDGSAISFDNPYSDFVVPGFGPNDAAPPNVGPKPGMGPQPTVPSVQLHDGNDQWSLPSQQPASGGLRVHNMDDDDDWKDTILHYNRANQ